MELPRMGPPANSAARRLAEKTIGVKNVLPAMLAFGVAAHFRGVTRGVTRDLSERSL